MSQIPFEISRTRLAVSHMSLDKPHAKLEVLQTHYHKIETPIETSWILLQPLSKYVTGLFHGSSSVWSWFQAYTNRSTELNNTSEVFHYERWLETSKNKSLETILETTGKMATALRQRRSSEKQQVQRGPGEAYPCDIDDQYYDTVTGICTPCTAICMAGMNDANCKHFCKKYYQEKILKSTTHPVGTGSSSHHHLGRFPTTIASTRTTASYRLRLIPSSMGMGDEVVQRTDAQDVNSANKPNFIRISLIAFGVSLAIIALIALLWIVVARYCKKKQKNRRKNNAIQTRRITEELSNFSFRLKFPKNDELSGIEVKSTTKENAESFSILLDPHQQQSTKSTKITPLYPLLPVRAEHDDVQHHQQPPSNRIGVVQSSTDRKPPAASKVVFGKPPDSLSDEGAELRIEFSESLTPPNSSWCTEHT